METPEFFQTKNGGDHFIIDDLLDFPNDESLIAADVDGGFEAAMTGTSTDSSAAIAADNSCNSSFSTVEPHFPAADIGGPRGGGAGNFSSELCVPYDDLAELEWPNFEEESYSSEDLEKLQLIQGMKTRANEAASDSHHYQALQSDPIRPIFRSEVSVPAKARSKRSRAAPGNWTSRLLAVAPTTPQPVPTPTISSSWESDASGKKPGKSVAATSQRKKEAPENSGGGEGRRCLHCATDKTPQWRTGPMGPKTLCNACGVRYKSGRLVPEYRPAASPTFVLTKHSNSHRKVLELRRQKEMVRAQQHQQPFLHHHHHHHHHHQNMMFDVTNGDDYLIHQHMGPDYRQLI